MRATRIEGLWLVLLLAGVVLPYVHAVPWLVEHGPDVARFADELFATAISRFFGWDVIVAVVIMVAVAVTDPVLRRADRVAVVVGALLGASVGLPLYLWLRARRGRLTGSAAPARPSPAAAPR